ncbi:MAG: ParA family protein [Chloroflexota bacterium]
MQVITLLNEKGGVGKTTLAVHIAAGLALKGNRVVIIDADPQGHATMAVNATDRGALYDLIHPKRNASWDSVLEGVSPSIYTPEGTGTTGQLFIVPGNIETRNIATSIDDVTLLKRRLLELESVVDYVVIDTSPTPSLFHSSIYIATDYILMPTELEAFSVLGGVKDTASRANAVRSMGQQQGLEISNVIGIIPNKFRSNTLTHDQVLEHLQVEYGDLVWEPIKLRIVYAEAALMGQLIYAFAPEHRATKDMYKLVDRVLARINLKA